MYYIRKYSNCWAIHDDVVNASRKLTEIEIVKLKIEFPSLEDEKVLTVFTDKIRSIIPSPDSYPDIGLKPPVG
jgi:hypothetical protein